MQCLKKTATFPVWLYKSPRILCVIGFVCLSFLSLTAFVPQASAAALSTPGGHVSDPVVRQVDIDQLAIVRIITTINAHLAVQFTSTSSAVSFPLDGSNYSLELSGSGTFISAHGDILTADHVVNPPHDSGLDDFVYQTAGQDVADYINTHYQTSGGPFTADEATAYLEEGLFGANITYGTTSSRVYLNTSFTGPLTAAKIESLPTTDYADVDRIEAQSSFTANDVAIIHVNGMDNMPSIQLDDSSQVAVQDNLTVVGFPGLGDVSDAATDLLTASVNKIYVSALKTSDGGAPLLEVAGNIEHGDSGGPALDDAGNIVGIVSFQVNNPGETGETAFLQASNSAKTLIQSAGVDTKPGSFQKAWTQAFSDYASPVAGHWHKAAQELQSLVNNYTNFHGASQYLDYAQEQASHELLPAPPSTGINPLVFLALAVFVLLVLILVLVIVRQRRRVASTGVGIMQVPLMPFGSYPNQAQPNAFPVNYNAPADAFQPVPATLANSGVYPPTPASYGAQEAIASGVYPPTPASYNGSDSGTYMPAPANYVPDAWYEQSTNLIPQTPLAGVPETPLPQPEENIVVDLPVADDEVVHPHTHEYLLPTWVPTIEIEEHSPVAPVQMQSGLFVETMAPEMVKQEEFPVVQSAVPVNLLQSNDGWPTFMRFEEDQQTFAATEVELPQQPFAAPQEEVVQVASFEVVEQTVVTTQEEATAVLPFEVNELTMQAPFITWLAPCGHSNAPDVRFCRVCGQPVQSMPTQERNATL
jgi:S1-C subfamily serine protease